MQNRETSVLTQLVVALELFRVFNTVLKKFTVPMFN